MTEQEQLEATIRDAQDRYYATGDSLLSDAEYDACIDRLKVLDPKSPLISEIGQDRNTFRTKVAHRIPMGSQEKAADDKEFLAWKQEGPFAVQWKLDGASLELQYDDGRLVRAVTRGDGFVGEDITENIMRIPHLPKTLQGHDITAVRGEIVLYKSVFEQYFKDVGKNCRNTAVGLMKKAGGVGCEHLRFIAYDISIPKNAQTGDITETDVINRLHAEGFMTPEHVIAATHQDVIELRNQIYGTRDIIPVDIDGLVVKKIVRDIADIENNRRPKTQIAFKFPLDEAITPLRDIEWSQNGQTFTPVALLDPVQLNGTTVSRASLANIANMQALDIVPGCSVVVRKSGEIIPQVVKVIHTEAHTECFAPPTTCPACGSKLEMRGAFVVCPSKVCPEVVRHRVSKWLDTLGIKGAGPSITARFVSTMWSDKPISELYSKAHKRTETLWTKSEQKVLEALEAKKDCTFPEFVAGFDIPGIGKSTIDVLQRAGFDTLEKLTALLPMDAENIPGIGAETIQNLARGLDDNIADMLMTLNYITPHAALATGAMSGEIIVFTGEMRIKRTEAEKLVRGAGGQTKTSVVRGTTFLVTNDTNSGSSKNKKAAELHVPVINEQQFMAWVQSGVRPEVEQ